MTTGSGGADLVESAKCLYVLLISDNQSPLFRGQLGQT